MNNLKFQFYDIKIIIRVDTVVVTKTWHTAL